MKTHHINDYLLESVKLILPVILGFVLGYFPIRQQYNATEQGKLNQDLNQLLVINMQYSFVEDPVFIDRLNRHRVLSRDSSLKYEAYCAYVFNLIENTAEYFSYNKAKISHFLDINDSITTHKEWWLKPENYKSYPEEFKQFVGSYIK